MPFVQQTPKATSGQDDDDDDAKCWICYLQQQLSQHTTRFILPTLGYKQIVRNEERSPLRLLFFHSMSAISSQDIGLASGG